MTKNFIRNLYFAPACFGSTMLATGVAPYYEYDSVGKRTGTIQGYRYMVVLPERGYEALSVKVPGRKTLNINTDDNESVRVEFTDLRVRPYVDYRNGNALAVTATASAVRAVSD